MNWKQILADALKAAREIGATAKAAGRELTDAEMSDFRGYMAKAEEARAKIKAIEESEALFKQLADIDEESGALDTLDDDTDKAPRAKSLGDHYAKEIGAQMGLLKSRSKTSLGTTEFRSKAATDPHLVGSVYDLVLVETDRTVVRPYRRPLVSDLLGSGSLSGTGVTYFVEGVSEGSITTVAQGGQKPQIHFGDPTTKTDKLTKIAAWWDTSDEMVEDIPFMVSEINNRGLRMLSEVEEAQLLQGDGVGTNLLGIFNRSGVQALTLGVGEDVFDAIFRAMMAVQGVSGLTPDGILINPTDYQTLRLRKDGNDQYLAGGPFQGAYGQGGLPWQPPIWGLNTVVTSAQAAGTIGVGAFKAATTVYRKGGVRVETTNSDQGKFTKDIITTRIEERLALAVRVPSAIAELDITP